MNRFLIVGACIALAGQPVESAQLEIVSIATVTDSGDNTKPFVAVRPTGGAYLAWAQNEGDRTAVLFAATRDGERFTEPVRVSAAGMDLDLGAESGPSVAVGRDGTIYVVWASGSWSAAAARNASSRSGGRKDAAKLGEAGDAEHGSHASGKGAPMRPSNLNIYLARSNDDGRTFSVPIKINDDPDGSEHRFPTVTAGRHDVYVAWLDKRPSATGANSCNVYLSASHDGGRSFSSNINATAGQDNSICHCCRVALATSSERVFVAFRNDRQDIRDNFLVSSAVPLMPFSKPAAIEQTEWSIPMCPFNGPSLASDNLSNLHAVWMTGGDVAGEPLVRGKSLKGYKVLYRQLEGGTEEWGLTHYVAEGEHPRLAVMPSGVPAVAWERGGIISVMLLGASAGPDLALSVSGAYPSLAAERGTGELFVAWQDQLDGSIQIKFARVKPNGAATKS